MQVIKSLPPYRQSLCEKVLHTATESFRKQGIKAVKMDDIAKRLSISKRTLYELFANKEALLFEVVRRRDEYISSELSRIVSVQSNVMDVIIAFYKMKAEELRVTTPAFYEDLYRYPKVIKYLKQQHENSADKAMAFFHRGVEEGYFRSEVNYEIVSMMAEVEVNYAMSSKFYKNFSLLDIYKSIVLVSIRGFSTAKGLKKLEEFDVVDRKIHLNG